MIMQVIATRQRLGWGSFIDIIEKIPKYSSTIAQPYVTPVIWDPAFVRLLHEVEAIFDGSAKDTTNGAIYWADLSKPVDNEWFQEKIMNNLDVHKRVADMNSLTFFK